ncbi:hypothetical protein H4J42_05825, partial [Colwellia sp. BRX8-8]|nr:hypothetical protein [Colwellia sp. BRX8-8]
MALAKINSNDYGKESELSARLSTEIKQFWQQGYFSSFSGVDKIRINYATFTD